MPFNSLSKLKNSLLSDNASLLPPERHVVIRTGYRVVALEARYLGSDGLVNNLIPLGRVENGSGYVIYRATGLNGPWTAVGGLGVTSQLTALSWTGWYDYTATGNGITYYYSGVGYKTGVGGSSFLYEIPSPNIVSGRAATPIIATGGHVTGQYNVNYDGIHTGDNAADVNQVRYAIHVYTGTANFVTTSNSQSSKLSVLMVVGGGGAGGKNYGGGGGGGGIASLSGLNAATVASNTTYSITIGAGASSNLGGGTAVGANGGNSIAFGYTGLGGGGGGGRYQNGASGGCGGGGGGDGGAGGAARTGYGWLGNGAYSGIQGISGETGPTNVGGGGGGMRQYNSNGYYGDYPLNMTDATGSNDNQYNINNGYAAIHRVMTLLIGDGFANSTNMNYFSAGGGGGGELVGYGDGNVYNPGAGNGSADWGADYYGDPNGKGTDANHYGCGGGGGGKGGGGGGAGFRGMCIITYPTSGGLSARNYGRVFATGG